LIVKLSSTSRAINGVGFKSANDVPDRDPDQVEVFYRNPFHPPLPSGPPLFGWLSAAASTTKLTWQRRWEWTSVELDHPIVASEVLFRFTNKKRNEMQLGQVELYGYSINDPAAPWAVAPPLFTVSTLSGDSFQLPVLLQSDDLVSDLVAANPQLGVFPEEVSLVESLTSAPVKSGSDVIIPTIERTKAAASDENLHLTLLFRETVRVRLDPVGSLRRSPGQGNAELAVELAVGGQATVGYAKRVVAKALDLNGENAADHLILTLHRGGDGDSAADDLDDGRMLDGLELGPSCVLMVGQKKLDVSGGACTVL
jgi:hypothetical protein